MSANIVYLPPSLEPIANRYAADHVEEVEGLNPKDKRYASAFNKAKNRYCQEYVELCGGIQKGNPTALKAVHVFGVFSDILFNDKGGFIKKYLGDNDKAVQLSSRLKGDIVHLAHIWLETAANMKIKRSDKDFSGLVYQQKTENKAFDLEKLKEVNLRRLKRSAVIAALVVAIDSVYKLEQNTLDKAIENAISDVPDNYLNTEPVYANLANALKKPLLDAYKSINIGKVLSDALIGAQIAPTQEQIDNIIKGNKR
jgi:hypothetical protein